MADKKAASKTPSAKAVESTKKVAAKAAASTPKTVSKKAAPVAQEETPSVTLPVATSGFMKALTPSAELAAIVGEAPLPRTEVVKKMWVYIKANNLQDANKKNIINADDKLKAVFGKDQVGMFEMQKFLSQHLK